MLRLQCPQCGSQFECADPPPLRVVCPSCGTGSRLETPQVAALVDGAFAGVAGPDIRPVTRSASSGHDRERSASLVSRGVALSSAGRYEQAVCEFTEALGADPGNAIAYNNRGYAQAALRRHDAAIADFD